jgi:predicted ester cyclase
MSLEENKDIIRRFCDEAVNKRNLSVVDELIAADYIDHVTGVGDVSGSEGMKQHLVMGFTAFPDLRITIEDIVAEGDRVVSRITNSGTHKGDLMGIAQTGKYVTWESMSIDRIADGKCIEGWEVADHLGLMQQLGVIPTPE